MKKQYKTGDIVNIKTEDTTHKALIIHVCPKMFSYKLLKRVPLYKILWMPCNDMQYTWWMDENDMTITK